MLHTSTLPSLQQVEMCSPCAMRQVLAPSTLSSSEEEAAVRPGLISLVPWWQETRVLVVALDGKENSDVLKSVVSGVVL